MLDILNEDCWRHILSYIPLNDIARSERVSLRWQEIVLQYLRGTRIRIEADYEHGYAYERTHGADCRVLTLFPGAYLATRCFEGAKILTRCFEQVTSKLGPAIVASYCYHECILQILLKNCPNLKHLAFVGIGVKDPDPAMTQDTYNFNRLKQISFNSKYCIEFESGFLIDPVSSGRHLRLEEEELQYDDYLVVKFLGCHTLEEIIIYNNKKVTGSCLSHVPTALKSLFLMSCECLEADNILAAIQNLPGLTKLVLADVPPKIAENAHLLLNKVPELEHLTLYFIEKKLNEDIPKLISRLDRLKGLNFSNDVNITDHWLRVIQEGCSPLEMFYVSNTSVSGHAVVEFCQAKNSTLKKVDVSFNETVQDKHVLAIIDCCPKLEYLDVRLCRLSAGLSSSAAQLCAERQPPLRLYAEGTSLMRPRDGYPGLILFTDQIERYGYF